MSALPAWTEADRLAALWSYGILDDPDDAIFSDFTRIAAHVCGVPISVVNLVDEGRQWFAAEIGLGVRQTPLDISICAHAILQPGFFEIRDLALDSRFDRNPLVTGDPRLRYYGGALLQTSDGLPLGTMCVLDLQPRPAGLTPVQVETLEALARQVMAQLELRRGLREKTLLLQERDAALREKDLLVQEVHHRTKNSLAMVQSLLTLQANRATDAEIARQLRESAERIRTFSTMHEHLYRVGAESDVDLAIYLGSLVADQRAALASTLENRTIVLQCPKLSWPSSDAPTVGLILTELVINALKYGAGCITVTLERHGSTVVLAVEDEGTALDPAFRPLGSKGLGMRVITGLLRERRGHLEIDRARGHTCFVATLQNAGTFSRAS